MNMFGIGKDRNTSDKLRKARGGKTLVRQVILSLEEKSVKARKHRKKSKHDYVQCSQVAFIFHSALTSISSRPHKHFAECTNMSNLLGPVALTPWSAIPKITTKERSQRREDGS